MTIIKESKMGIQFRTCASIRFARQLVVLLLAIQLDDRDDMITVVHLGLAISIFVLWRIVKQVAVQLEIGVEHFLQLALYQTAVGIAIPFRIDVRGLFL